jgi:hypothetical protein
LLENLILCALSPGKLLTRSPRFTYASLGFRYFCTAQRNLSKNSSIFLASSIIYLPNNIFSINTTNYVGLFCSILVTISRNHVSIFRTLGHHGDLQKLWPTFPKPKQLFMIQFIISFASLSGSQQNSFSLRPRGRGRTERDGVDY